MSASRGRSTAPASTLIAAAALILAVPVANGAAPTKKPVPNTTSTLTAGHACPFKVIDKTLPASKRTETIFANGKHVITGPAREKLTNAKSGASVVVNSSGTVIYRKGSDGKTRYGFSGSSVLYFFPGDEGPFGTAGANGALYHVVGQARMRWHGLGVFEEIEKSNCCHALGGMDLELPSLARTERTCGEPGPRSSVKSDEVWSADQFG